MAKRKRIVLEEKDGIIGKVCRKCDNWSPLENYSKGKNGVGDRRSECKTCVNIGRKHLQMKPIIKTVKGVDIECRKCNRCDNIKPLTDFQKNKSSRLGVSSICRKCVTKSGEKRRKSDIILIEAEGKKSLYKKCIRCKVKQGVSEFYKNYQSGSGSVRSECKTCNLIKQEDKRLKEGRDFVLRDTAYIKGELGKRYKKCTEIKILNDFQDNTLGFLGKSSECRECLKCRARNFYVENKEESKARNSQWYRNNPEYVLNKSAKRRARKYGLPRTFSHIDQAEVKKHFNGCALTQSVDIQWDHVIPVSIGHAGTVIGNMVPLRSDLNASKKDKNLFEWFVDNKARLNILGHNFLELIEYLAHTNALTTQEYEDYVYWCFANPRTQENMISTSISSIQEWIISTGRQIPLPKHALLNIKTSNEIGSHSDNQTA
ncbi:hypothetical protein GJU41_11965 [Bacillus idriensis]|uniref:HNH endonuclease n=1 Tax=Metabacillus idriensis TaxID=324768 RepID=A0A6I2MA85_9BACI|nr:hypothetical protein [Metabacillus idriensis]MRX54689.1 hypothetical protein [Metabacillus idriensis]